MTGMVDFAEITQDLLAPTLDLIGLDRDPAYIGHYQASNRLQRSLAHLVVCDGQFSRLLACDTDGVLPIRLRDGGTGELAGVDTYGNLQVQIAWGPVEAEVGVADQAAPTSDSLYVANYYFASIDSDLNSLRTILTDVWDEVNHALTTKEAV